MANTSVVVNEVLCFIRKNFDRMTVSQIKPVLISFYKEDELVAAKEILLKALSAATDDSNIDLELPRMPKRQGENKMKLTADDLLKLTTIIDERSMWSTIPRFVAEDLDRIPFINAESMSVVHMARMMEIFEKRLVCIENRINTQELTKEKEIYNNYTAVEDEMSHMNDSDKQSTGDEKNTWVTVVKRSKKITSPTDVMPSVEEKTNKQTIQTVSKRRMRIVGTKTVNENEAETGTVKSGVKIVKKSVVHVDNLDSDCTAALLNDYLLSVDINVISCYPAKSWLKEDERDKVTAFRVCVPAEQRCRVLDSSIWSNGVILRDWVFKQASTNNGGHEQS